MVVVLFFFRWVDIFISNKYIKRFIILTIFNHFITKLFIYFSEALWWLHFPDIHQTDIESHLVCRAPKGRFKCFLWGLCLPISLLLCVTVPDCRRVRRRKWFWITFTMSLVWLSVFSFLMIWMITIIGKH